MPGIHHVTAIRRRPLKNFNFYTRDLGLRFVKKTIHRSTTSTVTTRLGTRAPFCVGTPAGGPGVGETHQPAFRVPLRSLGYWTQHYSCTEYPRTAVVS